MIKITMTIEPYHGSDGPSRNETLLEMFQAVVPLLADMLKPRSVDNVTGDVASSAPIDGTSRTFVGMPPRPHEYAPPVPAPEPQFDPEGVVASRPAPPTPETNVTAKETARRQAKLTLGYETFAGLLNLWLQNFDREGEQPDRAQAIREIASDSKKAGAVVTYVMGCGGLIAATRACLPQDVHKKNHRKIAENIAQVASALAFTDLSNLLEQLND